MSRSAAVALLIAVLAAFVAAAPCPGDEPSPFERWEPAIAAFEQQDRERPPAKDGVVFVGSSSIRLWNLPESFPGLEALNRGFGGSQLADSVHFADRLVLKHRPRTVVVYAGDNDVAAGLAPEQVAADFDRFVETVHAELPEAKIVYIAIKPSPSRWNLAGRMHDANRRIAAACEGDERLVFVDVFTPMLGDDGRPRDELFVEDRLHLSPAGYRLWTRLVAPHVERE